VVSIRQQPDTSRGGSALLEREVDHTIGRGSRVPQAVEIIKTVISVEMMSVAAIR